MATTKFNGPVTSVGGFKYFPSAYSSSRGMTLVATTLIRTQAASNAAATALTQLCGLGTCVGAWGNVRQPSTVGTQSLLSVFPFGSGSTVCYIMLANKGTGQLQMSMAGNATLDIFMLGYV